jgi:hypothetical protein
VNRRNDASPPRSITISKHSGLRLNTCETVPNATQIFDGVGIFRLNFLANC